MSRSLRTIAARSLLVGIVLGFHVYILVSIGVLFGPLENIITIVSCVSVAALCLLLALELAKSTQDSAGGARAPSAITIRSLGLGVVLGFHVGLFGAAVSLFNPVLRWVVIEWSGFAMVLCVFHSLEFFWSATFEPGTVSSNAFLLNHSSAYHASLAIACTEFWVEACFFPSWKASAAARYGVFAAGLGLVVCGQAVRSLGMWTAQANFTHLVARQKRPSHQLVRRGVYSILRHPAYFGWFWWSLGTQLLLANPVSLVIYAIASWSFFADRIPIEEAHLVDFFGLEYLYYAQTTIIGIPFVRPYASLVNFGRDGAKLLETSSLK